MQARLIKFYQMEKKTLTFHVEFKDGVGPTAFPPTWPRANSVKGKKACVRLTIVSRLILMSAKIVWVRAGGLTFGASQVAAWVISGGVLNLGMDCRASFGYCLYVALNIYK